MDITSLSIRSLSALVRGRKVSIDEILNAFNYRITTNNPDLKALREWRKHLEQSEKEEIESGDRLAGIPFTAKDHINVSSLSLSEGTNLGYQSLVASDCSAVAGLKKAGAFCIGKGNMAEYGKYYHTSNNFFGTTKNPLSPKLSPGGSGGGDAAAVAARFCSFGLGADSGGSIRVPANYCGLFGLAPTPGRISQAGLFQPAHSTRALFRVLGPLARSLDDIDICFRCMAAFDPKDPLSLPAFPASHLDEMRSFAVLDSLGEIEPCEQISQELESFSKKLEKTGYIRKTIDAAVFRKTLEPFVILAGPLTLLLEDSSAISRGTGRNLQNETAPLKALRKKIAERLPPLTPELISECWLLLSQLRAEVLELFSTVDCVLAPVTASLPPNNLSEEYLGKSKLYESHENFLFSSMTNFLALPALAFPTSKRKQRVLGLQLIGPRYGEGMIINTLRKVIDPHAAFVPDKISA